jgi:hypothetical protein
MRRTSSPPMNQSTIAIAAAHPGGTSTGTRTLHDCGPNLGDKEAVILMAKNSRAIIAAQEQLPRLVCDPRVSIP